MCGICGIVTTGNTGPIGEETILRMRDVLTHRGPDEAGVFLRPHVALGHRRLSIIDLTSAGKQPMTNEDGSVWLTFNGEVYNFRDLRHELSARGHVFRSHTDSEVLVHLYEEVGARLVERLRGMFAFAVWDDHERTLLLVRDRFGIKPLYYAVTPDGTLVFGSEIKSLLASGIVEPRLRPEGVSQYLANRFTTGAETMYAGIRRLLPGHAATWRDGSLSIRQYWHPPVSTDKWTGRTDAQLVEEFYAHFEESVQLRMISDAPIGVFLSGGLDSSAITAVMTRHSAEPVRSFSVAFDDPRANELSYARQVAQHLGTEHREVVVSPESYFGSLPKLIWHEDEPIAFPSSIPLYFVSELATEHVKVVLTGEGSDELLAGYGKYSRALYNIQIAQFYGHLPKAMRGWIRRTVAALPSSRLTHRLMRTFLVREPTVSGLYLENFTVFDQAQQLQLLSPEFRADAGIDGGGPGPFADLREELARYRALPLLDQLLLVDWHTYLQELLMKQDQMSMAASIESRVPFLDHELAEFVARLPSHLKLRGFATKRVLRQAMRNRLPHAIIHRRKWGFPTPLGTWLRGKFTWMLDELLLSDSARARHMYDMAYVERLIREHRTGRVDHTERLWALLNLEVWCRTCLDEFSLERLGGGVGQLAPTTPPRN